MAPLRVCAVFGLIFLASCVIGPDYKKPDVASLVPTDWRWKVAAPQDMAPKGPWWTVFEDPTLDELETLAVS
ncbi:MAG: RND transporter, partial [Burkholderiales bacterium]